MIKRFAEHINESAKKFKIGDRVEINKQSSCCEFLKKRDIYGTIINTDGNVYGVEFDEHIKGHDSSHYQTGRSGKYGYCWNLYSHEIELVDKEEDKKRMKKREELKLKHIDVDPYGEEEWSD